MPIYSFPVLGNPSSASTRSVMLALGLVMLSLFSGFGIMYLIGLMGIDTQSLLWVPVLTTAPAVVFAMFAVVNDEAKREARFRDMSQLVSDALALSTGIELGERDIRRMVDGDVITDAHGGNLHIEEQTNGRSTIMTLIREEPAPLQQHWEDHNRHVEEHKDEKVDSGLGTTSLPIQQSSKEATVTPLQPEASPSSGKAAKSGQSSGSTSLTAAK